MPNAGHPAILTPDDAGLVHIAGPETITGEKTFSGGLITGGELRHSIDALNGGLFVSEGTHAFNDGNPKTLFQLPANAIVVDFHVIVNATFNAGTSNALDVDDSTFSFPFVVGINMGVPPGTVLRMGDANMDSLLAVDIGGSSITIQSTYTETGTPATAGLATFRLLWTLI